MNNPNDTPDVSATVEPTPNTSTAITRKPRRTVIRKPANTGVVGTMPIGFDALRDALRAINGNTSMGIDSIRADVKRVTRSMPPAAMPPAGRGRWSGLRTYDFQNTLYAVNDRPDWRFTDRTLCVAWAVELAANKCDFPAHADYIRSTRTDYVRGRHGTNVIDPAHRVSHVWPWVIEPPQSA